MPSKSRLRTTFGQLCKPIARLYLPTAKFGNPWRLLARSQAHFVANASCIFLDNLSPLWIVLQHWKISRWCVRHTTNYFTNISSISNYFNSKFFDCQEIGRFIFGNTHSSKFCFQNIGILWSMALRIRIMFWLRGELMAFIFTGRLSNKHAFQASRKPQMPQMRQISIRCWRTCSWWLQIPQVLLQMW